MYVTAYQCIACNTSQSASYSGLVCPVCGANLDIRYDYAAAARAIGRDFGAASHDIFRYRALLPLQAFDDVYPLRIGGTPLYPAPRLGQAINIPHLYLKDDSANPSASFKDRASAVVLRRAIDCGAPVVATASTGNAGSSLACLSAAMGMQSVIFIPQSAPVAKLSQALAYGSHVLAVRGNYDDAFDLCLAACAEFGWFNRSTGVNPYTREGKKTCAFEIWEDLGHRVPDRVVVPTGDGNILSGLWKGWCDLQAVGLIDRLPKIDCAQSQSSAAISHTVQRLRRTEAGITRWSEVTVESVHATTVADSISVDQPRDGLAAVKAILQSGGEAVAVADSEILAAVGEISRLTGIFPEPAAAAPWAAIRQMAGRGCIAPDESVVCIVTGSGLKDSTQIMQSSRPPQVIDPGIDAIRGALHI